MASAPLKPELAQIDAIASRTDLARVLGSRLRADVDPINATNYHTENLFGLFVTQGLEDPSRNIAYLLQGGLGMPSRDYYLSDDAHMVATRAKYQTYIGALLQAGRHRRRRSQGQGHPRPGNEDRQGAGEPARQPGHAQGQQPRGAWPTSRRRRPASTGPRYFKAAGLDGQQQIDAWQPTAITGLSALTASEPLQAWKDLLVFHTINQSAGLLPKAYADLSFDFYGRTLQGTPQAAADAGSARSAPPATTSATRSASST